MGAPGRAAAADPIAYTTASTFVLVPESGLIHVTVTQTIKNSKPSTATTYYYVDSAAIVFDQDGINARASTSGGSARVSVKAGEPGFFSTATVSFPRILYGQSRTITLTYDLPGGAPRSDSYTRANAAYARFCTFLGGAYIGSIDTMHLVVPAAFGVSQYYGDTLQQTRTAETLEASVPATTRTEDSDLSQSCFEAINPGGYVTADYTSASGVALHVSAWPGDSEWLSTMSGATGALDDLEALIGQPPTSKSISVAEVAGEAVPGFGGGRGTDPDLVRMSEDANDPLVAADEMAHLWFNDRFSAESWLTEGYAAYLARLVVADAPDCEQPDASVLEGISLLSWTNLSRLATDADVAAAKGQYDTACWVVTTAANRMSADDFKAIFAAATSAEIPYVGSGSAEKLNAGPIGWRRWLDLVDERFGYDAADPDWLQRILLIVGVEDKGTELAARSSSRASYHQLLTEADGWGAPLLVRQAISHWLFSEADAAMEVASQTAQLHQQAVAKVPELSSGTKVQEAFEAANDLAALDAAHDLAASEFEAAEVVADAVAAAAADRGPLEAVGLLGADLGKDADDAAAALVSGELDTASADGNQLLAAASGANLAGGLRLGGAAVVVLGGGVGFNFFRRRRAGSKPAAPDADAPAAPDAPSETEEGGETGAP